MIIKITLQRCDRGFFTAGRLWKWMVNSNGRLLAFLKAGEKKNVEISDSPTTVTVETGLLSRANTVVVNGNDNGCIIKIDTWVYGWKMVCILIIFGISAAPLGFLYSSPFCLAGIILLSFFVSIIIVSASVNVEKIKISDA